MSEFITCDKCNGTGMVDKSGESIVYSTRGVPLYEDYKCNKCQGTGKLTWLENIFGKQQALDFEKLH